MIARWMVGAAVLLALRAAGRRGPASGGTREFAPGRSYPPGSAECVALFEAAARELGAPAAWARSDGLRRILLAESAGRVGIPNYKYTWTGRVSHSDPMTWVPVLESIRHGGSGYGPLIETFRCGDAIVGAELGDRCDPRYSCFVTVAGPVPGEVTCIATATGLGQLLARNVERYYPSGRAGVGVPIEEAAGMLAYIADNYGNPDAAWAHYQRTGGY